MSNRQSIIEEEIRRAERVPIELKTIVQVKENSQETWKEVTKVTTISKNGAGFSLNRAVTVGRLVTLVMPLDPELRAYDHNADLYPVMGLVQYCNKGLEGSESIYHVGVGFIGKNIPESFKNDPHQSYRIAGMSPEGLWTITEASNQFKARKDARFWIAMDVTITLLKKDKKTVSKQHTITQNVSSSGVSIESTLDVEIGDKVKFACKPLDFYALAFVRNRKESKNKDKGPTIHLEFIEAKFPIEKVTLSHPEPEEHDSERTPPTTETISSHSAPEPLPAIGLTGFELERF